MRSKQKFSFSYSFFLFGAVFFLFVSVVPKAAAQTALPQEALADLIKPSIVRIAQHVSGTAKIPEIKVDIRQRLVAVVPNKFNEVPVDEYLVGSGFVIHPDGYIATNAHVVSKETVKQGLASESALSALYANALFLSDAEMQDFLDTETDNSFSKEVLKYVIDHSVFQLQSDVVVLRPNSEKKTLPEMITEGFPAAVVYVDDNFMEEDKKDVALLHIEETNLPALSLGSSEGVTVGTRTFIFGFPATAELRQNSSGEATFTGGLVSAIKQSAGSSFKLFQTDAKVSEGSSGGPLLDEYGNVIGLVTFQTDELNRASGDNFAFALPVEVIKEAARSVNVTTSEGEYSQYFKKGFVDFSSKRCGRARASFLMALEGSNTVFLPEKYLDSYFERCDVLEQSGLALNTRLDEWQESARALGNPFFYLAAAALFLFGIFGAAIFWILRQVRREEQEIEVLESRLNIDETRIKGYESLSRERAHQSPLGHTTREKKKII